MKYTIQSSKYALKNFIYLFPLAIIPAYFLSLSTDQEAIYCALESIFTGNINDFHFSHIFRAISIINFASWYSVVFGIAGVVMMIVCGALMMALLDKHMRIGKRTFTGVFAKLNDNLVSTTGFVLLILAIYELWALLTSGLVYVYSLIPLNGLAYTLASVSYLVMHVVLIYVIGKIYLWLPCMQITGFKAFEALRYSQYLVSAMKWKLMISQLVVLFFVQAIICLCALSPYGWLFTLLTTLVYTLVIIIFCVRMMVAYFDREQIERADLKKYY
ncbi:MAG: hypothetical protein IJ329_04385 [Clostridia bacterium]|nr:hypothetical protein [Clostridia bacterium]